MVSTVSGVLDINQATLSGAIDIVVVEQPDGAAARAFAAATVSACARA